LAGFIIDCKTDDLDTAARFWSAALGMAETRSEDGIYKLLDASARDMHIEVQKVDHDSRLHLDIETDDIDAEVRRLEGLGARRIAQIKTWWVMEAPTGQRFCVVRSQTPGGLAHAHGVTSWPDAD
jgi:predicted enzyme related to lactoylglutathione lyase